MPTDRAIVVSELSHRYVDHLAIDDLSLEIRTGEIFVFLGPNGSGKTTLFRVLSTLIPLQTGEVTILGRSLRAETDAIRQKMGVVFQAPSLDKKLTVDENLYHHGRLYGLPKDVLKQRKGEMLEALGLSDRATAWVEKLSGGQRRRVELAKGMLHRPQLLLMDEPSTGLDPGARADLWKYLHQVCEQEGVSIVMTTHLLEEAERADRIAIVDRGKLAALDTPSALQESVGGDSITIGTENPHKLAESIRATLDCEATILDGSVRIEQPDGHLWISRIVEAFPEEIDDITLRRPTLEDVFIDLTGHKFLNDE